jgi:hypothetical protein
MRQLVTNMVHERSTESKLTFEARAKVMIKLAGLLEDDAAAARIVQIGLAPSSQSADKSSSASGLSGPCVDDQGGIPGNPRGGSAGAQGKAERVDDEARNAQRSERADPATEGDERTQGVSPPAEVAKLQAHHAEMERQEQRLARERVEFREEMAAMRQEARETLRVSTPPPAPLQAPVPSELGGVLQGLTSVVDGMQKQMTAGAHERSSSRGPGRNGPRSVIKFSPEMPWPDLDDSDKDVEGHIYRFRQMCGMMNDGEGCKPSEMLVFFGRTLEGDQEGDL